MARRDDSSQTYRFSSDVQRESVKSEPGGNTGKAGKTMKALRRLPKAFTLVEIMIVIAITAIVLAIALPNWLRAREHSRASACQENLTKIEGAKEVYALDHNLRNGASVALTDLFDTSGQVTGYIRKEPRCPANGVYTANDIGEDPTCSFFGREVFAEFPHALP
ncbi:MAG: prepilin-type N-terminal cleavage/methylation domain-containing protein [bacterium]